jgi:peptidoglycan hydrolase FlgJ
MDGVTGMKGPAAAAAVADAALPRGHNRQRADDPARIVDAAKQFESLLIGQLLKSMRASGEGGWLGTSGDQAGGQIMELAQEQLAQALAEQGGRGLRRVVVDGLKREAKAAGAPPQASPRTGPPAPAKPRSVEPQPAQPGEPHSGAQKLQP